jgi:hypothetical protein
MRASQPTGSIASHNGKAKIAPRADADAVATLLECLCKVGAHAHTELEPPVVALAADPTALDARLLKRADELLAGLDKRDKVGIAGALGMRVLKRADRHEPKQADVRALAHDVER